MDRIGPYRVVRHLGAGGMGDVVLAHDERLDRHVAIKRLRGEASAPEERERVLTEARAAAKLNHPSVVQVYDVLDDADGPAIVMEYVEGRMLAELLKAGELTGGEVVEILLQVCDGLRAAHDGGLVHRDLKGENVMVTDARDAKVLDFGIATILGAGGREAATRQGVAAGTLRAMSPEQADSRSVDARSDLFSLGVLLYEATTGRSPFLGRTSASTLARVLQHEPPSPDRLNPTIPLPLSELTLALLAKDPEGRPTSVGRVAETLEAARDTPELDRMVLPRLEYVPIDSSAADSKASRRRRSRDRARTRMRGIRPSGDGRSAGWRRLGLVGALLATGVGAFVLVLGREGQREALDGARVMVFPLVGGTDVPPSTGEDIATILGHTLDGTGVLRWLDGWSALDVSTRRDVRDLELSTAAALAREGRAAHFVTGRVVVADTSARVFLELHDARNGERITGTEGRGPLVEPWTAGLSALSGLLPTLLPTEVPELAIDFRAADPQAVARFLLGEAAHRRARVGESLERFSESFAIDSTFWLAGIRAAQAASWEHDQEAARALLERVLRLDMPPESKAFADGLLAYVRYDAERAVEQLMLALDSDSTLSVGWAALGEVYRHRAPREPWAGERTPFARALELDSLAGYVLFHRLEELVRTERLDRVDVLSERFAQHGPDPWLVHQIDIMRTCVAGGPLARDWTGDVHQRSRDVAFAATQLLTAGRQLPCAEVLYRAVLIADTAAAESEGRYWTGLLGLTGSKLAKGDTAAARRLIAAASQGYEPFQSLIDRSIVDEDGVRLPDDDLPWPERAAPLREVHEGSLTRWSELAILVGAVHPALADLADLGAADIRSLGSWSEIPYRTSVWLLGLHEIQSGRPAAGDSAAARLREIADGYDDEVLRDYTQAMASTLVAHRILGSGDEEAALETFRTIRANADEGTVFSELIGSFALERHVLADLEERLGDPERALILLRGFDAPSAVTNAVYLRSALESCARIASALNRAAEARVCRDRLEGLR